jgi:hypothetical protein
MDERFRRVEQVEQRVQMLLGVFSSHGVLPLEFKPAYSVGDLLLQHLEALEQEADEKGGVQQMLADHFAKVYKVGLPSAGAAQGLDPLRNRHPDPLAGCGRSLGTRTNVLVMVEDVVGVVLSFHVH